MKTFSLFVISFFLIISNVSALETTSPHSDKAESVTAETQQKYSYQDGAKVSSPAEEETILLSAPRTEQEIKQYGIAYFIEPGISLAVHDKKFRDFLDYGPAISMGIEKEIKENLSISFGIGLEILKGKWEIGGNRESIFLAGEEYYPGFVPEEGEILAEEDLPEENYGTSVIINVEGMVISAESLQNIDAKTTLYLLPLTVNAKYWLHKDKKVNPYVGGGIGWCFARRDVISSAVKEKFFNGPDYLLEMSETQYVTGLVVNFLAGFEIPLKNNMKIVAQANMGLYDLNRFDPIFEISYKLPDPDWYYGSYLSSFSNEEPVEIGVFDYEIVSSIYIGLVVPF